MRIGGNNLNGLISHFGNKKQEYLKGDLRNLEMDVGSFQEPQKNGAEVGK